MSERIKADLVCQALRMAYWRRKPALKVERVYQVPYESRARARIDVVNWIEGFYNSQRLHTSIDFQVPNILEKTLAAA